jgi:hypothetical protein
MAKVYVKLDSNKVVTAINSSIFLTDPSGWTEIDSGEGDKYVHAMSQYLPKGLTDEFGFFNYKYNNGLIENTDKVSNATALVLIPHRTVVLGTNWTYDSGTKTYRQDVAIVGMSASDIVICDVITSGSASQILQQEAEWLKIGAFETGANKITFIADAATTVAISVLVRGI